MKPRLSITNITDTQGNPGGGAVAGTGVSIQWQAGELGNGASRREPNGAFVSDIIGACISRLAFYETVCEGKFRSKWTTDARKKLEDAVSMLHGRTTGREERGVEGLHKP